MDAVYIFRHSPHQDRELRYSLRSVARHAAWLRKVWIFGDRPEWLSDDRDLVEHAPHSEVAWIAHCRTPVTNHFLLITLAALLPDVEPEMLFFADDYVLLDRLSPDAAKTAWYVQDLDDVSDNRGTGLYKTAIWNTYELLRRMDLPRLNFESHVPHYITKKRILAAARDFRDHFSEDRFGGPLAWLSIYNHAMRHDPMPMKHLITTGLYAGFHMSAFTYSEIRSGCAGKLFLNFDDASFNAEMDRFLSDRFPEPCRFEKRTAHPC